MQPDRLQMGSCRNGVTVVEHKAQTHLRGFAVVSLFVGASCPDAHMYRNGADVRHMPGAGWGEEKQHNPALSGTMHPKAAPDSGC
jgi:hypothetical protein